MKYANAIFNETLRLHPSVPKNTKQCVKDEILPDGTPVPKGASVIWFAYGMARDPRIWGPDALEYKPERWINPDKVRSQYQNPMFHAGPRICLGKSLAELEGVFVLVSLFSKYRITVVPGQDITYGNSLTLPMRDGIKCTVERR
jgi:cytochrome P450